MKRARKTRAARLILPAPCFALLAALSLLALGACSHPPPPPRPYLAFVAASGSHSVVAIDLASFQLIASIPVAGAPQQLVVRPRRRELYVVAASGDLSVIGFPELRVLQTLRVGRSARALLFSPDGDRAFMLDPESREIVFAEGERGRVPRETARLRVQGELAGLALTPDGNTLVVADAAGARLVFVDARSRKILGTTEVGKGPRSLVILPDGSKVFAADTGEEKISAVDIASRQILSHIETGSKPGAMVLKPDGGELFVLGADSAMLTIVDAFHDYVEQSLTTGKDAVAGLFRRDSSVLYIANAGDGSVMAFDVQNRTLLNSTHAGTSPSALALTPDGRFLVVADRASASLAVLRADPDDRDRNGNRYMTPSRSLLLTTIPVGANPVAVEVPDWLR